jgi:phosphotransacetylase
MSAPVTVDNRTFGELAVGDSVADFRSITLRDAELFSALSGVSGSGRVWGGLLLALLAETRLPGPGSVPVATDLRFPAEITVGAKVQTRLTVREKQDPDLVVLDCLAHDDKGAVLVTGTLTVRAPAKKIWLSCGDNPHPRVHDHIRHDRLVARCAGLRPALTAVVHPCDVPSVAAAIEAAEAGLIVPILVGPEAKILAAAAAAGVDIGKFRLVATPHSHAAAAEAVAMAGRGEVEALMKGSLHTDELMHAVVAPGSGLGTGRRISHCYLFDVAAYPRPLFITDAAINIRPSLADKRDICQSAIELAHIVGVENPKIAILSAVEMVSDKLPSTIDAAALCKMAERGQITGGILDGPLAFDNAVSLEAARIKGIVSPVAGRADILLVPDLESGNMLAKQLTFFDGADGAGIVLGARLPIILTSRADPARTRIASCAIALLMVAARRSSA